MSTRPGDRVAQRLPLSSRGLFQSYLDEPLVESAVLGSSLTLYLAQLKDQRFEHELLNEPLAQRLAARCQVLVEAHAAATSEEHRRIIQAAVRYFVEEEDATSDMDPGGFDDDAVVIAEVEKELVREGLLAHS